ncbi:hypothetical protein V2J09_007203 [Rumex salicifolius]
MSKLRLRQNCEARRSTTSANLQAISAAYNRNAGGSLVGSKSNMPFSQNHIFYPKKKKNKKESVSSIALFLLSLSDSLSVFGPAVFVALPGLDRPSNLCDLNLRLNRKGKFEFHLLRIFRVENCTIHKMAILQGPVVCPTIRSRQSGACTMMSNEVVGKATVLRSQFRGCNGIRGWKANELSATRRLHAKRRLTIKCTFSSSSNGNGSKAENFSESDEDYVNSTVIEAVEVKSGSDGFTVKMRDGMYLKCVHNNPQGGHLPDYAPHPAIVLKMEDGTGLLLPIIVLETPSVLLMAALRNVHIARPTVYNVIKEMVEKMGFVVKLVRVTQRVQEAYYAKIYLSKVNNQEECITFDLRPSDAINIAVRCQVPIQVSKHLANSDGMRVVEEAHRLSAFNPAPNAFSFTEMDRPSGKTSIETEEFNLLRNMMEAASEERYQDAAKWRNELSRLRAKRNWA